MSSLRVVIAIGLVAVLGGGSPVIAAAKGGKADPGFNVVHVTALKANRFVFKARTGSGFECSLVARRGAGKRTLILGTVADGNGVFRVRVKLTGRGRVRLTGTCAKPSAAPPAALPDTFEGTAANQDGESAPAFQAAPAVDGRGASLGDAEGAIAWAMSRRGDTSYNWYCLRFVANAYNSVAAGYETPVIMKAKLGVQGTGAAASAPRGALLIFGAAPGNPEGHVGISLGDGTMIDAQRTVDVRSIAPGSYWAGRFVGWMNPPSHWPGRPSTAAPNFTPTPAPAPTPSAPAPAPKTYPETTGPSTNKTFTNYTNAGGTIGASIAPYTTLQISCRRTGFVVSNGNNWWYRIASQPWNNQYYATADAFYNNGATSGSLLGTPFVDAAIPIC